MRKLILRTFLFTALIAPAAAINNPLQCQTNVAVTPTLRAEGFTELVGDITLICTGGIPTALGTPVPQAQISFFMNTAVTSRVYSSGFSEALVIVDDPGSGVAGTSQTQLACADPSGICAITGNGTGAGTYDGSAGHPNVFPGRVSGNTVTFNVPIDGPAVVRTLRFTNIRVNATVFGGGSQQGATPVVAAISLGGVSMQISNATPTVGFVQDTLSFSARTPDNASASSGTSITQCSSPQRAAVLRFAEGAPTTAKTRTYAAFVDGDTSPAPAAQNVPGAVYVNESGFYGPSLSAPTVNFSNVGLADFGTRLRAVISNIPPGTQVFVSARNVVFSGGNPAAATAGTVARLIQNEGGAFAAAGTTRTLDGVAATQLSVQNGVATAVWEVLATNVNGVENFDFAVWVQGGTGAGTGVVNGSFGPAPPSFSAGSGAAASSSLPLPRFIADPNAARSVFSTGGCQVNVPTTTTLTTAIAGALASATLTATVTSASGVPSGTVTFYDGGNAISNSTTTLNSNGVAFFVTTLNAGQHSLSATFNPSSGAFLASTSATAGISLPKINSSVIITSSSSTSAPGQTVTFTATVNSPVGTPGGTIQFNDGTQVLASVVFNGGVARISTLFIAAGTHDISASYSGDTNYNPSSSHFTQVVNKLSPTLAIATNLATADYGQAVKLTATLGAAPPGGVAAATGTIQFFDGSGSLGSVGVASNAATMTLSNLGPGAHQFSASYSGDSNWNTARSGTVTTTVGRGPATTVLSIAATSAQTTFIATVGAATGTIIPGGTVQFTDLTTGNTLGTNTLSSGQGSMTLSAANLAGLAGHGIIAVYSGDTNFTSGTSNTVNLAILANTAGGPSINFAVDEFATIYGAGLASGTAQAPAGDPPTVLSDATVTVTDSIGGVRPAGLLYVSPSQINFLMPQNLVTGPATVVLKRGDTVVYSVKIPVALVAPGVFTTDGSAAAAQAIRVRADGTESVEDVASGIDIGSDTVYLVLYSTGIRGRSDLKNVTVLMGGQTLPALYAGQQGGFPGLDQVNVQLPPGLKGSGVINLSVTVDGFISNSATLTFK